MPYSLRNLPVNPKFWFDRITGVIFGIILLLILLGITLGTARLCIRLVQLFTGPDMTEGYLVFISDILSLFVLVELSRSLADYFTTLRLRMTFIVDAAIVFLVQEIMIKTYQHTLAPGGAYADGALLFVLGALRIASILVYQRERAMLESAAAASRGQKTVLPKKLMKN